MALWENMDIKPLQIERHKDQSHRLIRAAELEKCHSHYFKRDKRNRYLERGNIIQISYGMQQEKQIKCETGTGRKY